MKYLKKINENKEDIVEYIEQCFINLLDEGKEFYNRDNYLYMNIPIPEQIELNINGLLEFTEYITETSQEINTCIEKVKIKYPNLDYSIEMLRDTSYNGSSELYLYFFIEIRLKN